MYVFAKNALDLNEENYRKTSSNIQEHLSY